MRNNISVLKHYTIHPEAIDELLPFAGKTVFFRGIDKIITDHGRWRLEIDMRVNGQQTSLSLITTDSRLVDAWHTDDQQLNHTTVNRAIVMVLASNEDKLEELA